MLLPVRDNFTEMLDEVTRLDEGKVRRSVQTQLLVKVIFAGKTRSERVAHSGSPASQYKSGQVPELAADTEQGGELRLVNVDVAVKVGTVEHGIEVDVAQKSSRTLGDLLFRPIAVEEHAGRYNVLVVVMAIRTEVAASETANSCRPVNQTNRPRTIEAAVVLLH